MATLTASNSTSGITAATATPMAESEANSSAPEKRLSCEPFTLMPYSCGESSLTTAASKESTAPCSATKANTEVQTSFDRRTQLLTASGLIAGITPTLIRKGYGREIRATVSLWPDGESAGEPRAAC
jgi:hypothetical protein